LAEFFCVSVVILAICRQTRWDRNLAYGCVIRPIFIARGRIIGEKFWKIKEKAKLELRKIIYMKQMRRLNQRECIEHTRPTV